ncbi:MAG: RNA polymerase-binding protein RbpA [Janibacter sp.]|nr:RNA polymerase-binding protein RbpA [Janibacter sp.]
MAGGSAIRGSRIGAGPMGEAERGDAAPRAFVTYWCANGHEVTPSFSVDTSVEIPAQWPCKRCGLPAGQDKDNPPAAPTAEVYKTHLAYVKERRSDTEGEAILDERLGELRDRGLIQ